MRVLADDELRAADDLFGTALHHPPADDARWDVRGASYVAGRTLGADDPETPGRIAGTTTSFPTRTAVPGGAVLPVGAVTRVGVRADRTRRGLLTALMRAQLADLRARGEPLALLWASETGIYGRFGYGVATRARALRVRASPAALRPQAPHEGSVRLLDRAETPAVLEAVHDSVALLRPDGIDRPAAWWRSVTSRYDGTPLVAAVHRGPDGDDGFALGVPAPPATPRPGDMFVRTLRVGDMHAASPAAGAALWRFLLGMDLVDEVEVQGAPLDDPVDLLLARPRDAAVTGVVDETWLRLVDVPAALAARAFPAGPAAGTGPVPVLLAVHDPVLPDNAGVYRLGGGTAERVGPLGAVPAELECDVAALATAYLGDRPPSVLAGAGWWTVHDAAALLRADALFATGVAPWCGTHF